MIEVDDRPYQGDKYWCIFGKNFLPFEFVWNDDASDFANYKLKNYFKTKEEVTPEVIRRYKEFLKDNERVEW